MICTAKDEDGDDVGDNEGCDMAKRISRKSRQKDDNIQRLLHPTTVLGRRRAVMRALSDLGIRNKAHG